MIADFGYGVLVVAFLTALYSVYAAVYGELKKNPPLVESARRAMLLTWPLLTLAAGMLIYLLVNDHYEVQFVYEVTSRSMPLYLKVTAWWGGQAGSLLFWSWLMAAFTSLVTLRKWDRDREFLPWVIAVGGVTMAFFIGMNVFFENPFAKLYQTFNGNIAAYTIQPANSILFTPSDGRGLNPLLRHPGMIIHPPMLYLGFVSFVIPYAFAMAALITGRTDDRWIRITRRWTLWAWLFLSAGLVLGGRWAYDVLGWGGYWGWDPVEIAAFMPWLTGTAFLHSVMIQEKRGLFKYWNMLLIVLTYDLVIFGTFLTRSGVLSSVHSFAQSAIGPAFFAFIGITLITSAGLILYRWDMLKSETKMTSMLSREALFLFNNLLFMGILVICFWGVIYPLISELFTGQKVTVGPPFYERATSPLFAALLLLMGIAPLSAWGHSTLKTLGRAIWKPAVGAGIITAILAFTYTQNVIALVGFFLIALVILVTLYEYGRGALARQRSQGENIFLAFWNLTGRNRRRYGGYIIHISMMLMAIGILGIELFQVETQGTIAIGDSLELSGYTIKYKEVASWDNPGAGVNYTRAVVEVYDANGNLLGNLHPRKDFYFDTQQPMTIPGQLASLKDEVYVLLIDWEPINQESTTFKIFVNPLVNWLWLGSLLFFVGVLIAAWPERDAERVTVRTGKRAHQASAAD
ncbi:MAG: heme lyase CcmF/NrfE family subunit [Chloroflexota bacterium]|nr:heme lyase CcmF/NrfE family subunit [Chloroflexota bacterium]MBI5704876.1 heme lyase CcmF/NrfE family subunit [Chloroflexota bacterium]